MQIKDDVMQFEAKIWRKYYDRVQELSQILKNSKIDYQGNPPIAPLDRDAQINIESHISILLDKTNEYLDECYMKPKEPLWTYHRDDKRTWRSHESFAHDDLLTY